MVRSPVIPAACNKESYGNYQASEFFFSGETGGLRLLMRRWPGRLPTGGPGRRHHKRDAGLLAAGAGGGG